jgi:hypothetical protein
VGFSQRRALSLFSMGVAFLTLPGLGWLDAEHDSFFAEVAAVAAEMPIKNKIMTGPSSRLHWGPFIESDDKVILGPTQDQSHLSWY